jgi:hypothetical protein
MKPSKMKPSKIHSAWSFVGRDVEKLVNRWPALTVPIKTSELNAIMVVAISPGTLAASITNRKAKELARVFGDCYTKHPELTVALLKLIRDKWTRPLSQREQIQRHLGTKLFTPTIENGRSRKIYSSEVTDPDLVKMFYSATKQRARDVGAAKKSRQLTPSLRLSTTREMRTACVELERIGFNTGMGRAH